MHDPLGACAAGKMCHCSVDKSLAQILVFCNLLQYRDMTSGCPIIITDHIILSSLNIVFILSSLLCRRHLKSQEYQYNHDDQVICDPGYRNQFAAHIVRFQTGRLSFLPESFTTFLTRKG